MTPSRATIPSFGLFGDSAGDASAGFVHIETIAERSSLHDWEISPHRHDHGLQVLIIHQGHAAVQVDGAVHELTPPGFVVLPVGSVHGFRFAPNTSGHVLTLSQDFLGRAAPGDPLRHLLTAGGHGALPDAAAARVAVLAGEMLGLTRGWPAETGLLQALAEALARSLPHAEATADDARLARFRHLVEQHLREHRDLHFYAQRLGCTTRTLARLCQAGLGQSPLEVINRRLALEAQRLLRYTNASVRQVADDLGFADPSYFSRFYLRIVGHRPQAERGVSR